MSLFLFKALFVLLSWLKSTDSQLCPANGIPAGVQTTIRNMTNPSPSRYLLTGKGRINCYGVIKEWMFHTNDACNGGNIDFEVWRPVSGSNYELVGVNRFNPSFCPTPTNDVTFGVATADRIPVEPGYIIGWYQPNIPGISADFPASGSAGLYASEASTGSRNPGNQLVFTNQGYLDSSLKVTVMQGERPTIDNLPATVSCPENAISPLVVFTVIASHICNDVNAYRDAVPLTFTLSPSGTPFTLQNVTPATNGLMDVSTTGPIDYETQSVYQLTITVTGLGLSTSKVLTVNVIDVNEAHTITNLPNSISVSAPSTAAAVEVFKVLISEPDTNPAFPVKYYLNSWTSTNTIKDQPPFVVNPNTGSVTSSTDLLTWHLDYPTPSSPYPTSITYILTILATDGVVNKQGDLTITITNVKQPPVFLNLPASVTVDENLPGNSVIYEVLVAASPDTVVYEIIDPLTPFCIDEISGVVSLCSYAKLDYCKPNGALYTITINATNSVLSNQGNLTINIRWINSPPSFSQSTYTATINEKCTPFPSNCNVAATAVAVKDRDLSCTADSSSCSIIPGNGSTYFTMNGCVGVVNSVPIDLDSNPEYENIILLIEVRDSGPLTGYAKVIIKVINVNNFTPTFVPGSYVGSVEENLPGGTSVLTVAASDGDSGINGEFEYSILSTDPAYQYFEVDRTTGLVKTKQPLDQELRPPYTFTVYATDKGSSPLNGFAIVTVNVLDVNDVRPVIDCSNRPSDEPYPSQPCFYNYDLKYDALIGQNVTDQTFTANDVDPVQNSVTFNLLVPDDHFNMNTNNGLISVKKSLTEYTKYLLYVYAEDNGTQSLWSRIMNVRIDTYRPDRQYIDLTVMPKASPFDDDAFLAALRNVTYPWFMKIVSITNYDPNVQKELIVTVYALANTSTYLSENIVHQKVFVDRDDMLSRLRANIYGDPADILNVPILEDEFPVVKVMPTYMNWWLDTVEGIATIVCLSILGLLLLILAGVGICKGFKLFCFKEKTPPKPVQAWVDEHPKSVRSIDQDSVRYRSAHGRRESVSTVHSIILEKDL